MTFNKTRLSHITSHIFIPLCVYALIPCAQAQVQELPALQRPLDAERNTVAYILDHPYTKLARDIETYIELTQFTENRKPDTRDNRSEADFWTSFKSIAEYKDAVVQQRKDRASREITDFGRIFSPFDNITAWQRPSEYPTWDSRDEEAFNAFLFPNSSSSLQQQELPLNTTLFITTEAARMLAPPPPMLETVFGFYESALNDVIASYNTKVKSEYSSLSTDLSNLAATDISSISRALESLRASGSDTGRSLYLEALDIGATYDSPGYGHFMAESAEIINLREAIEAIQKNSSNANDQTSQERCGQILEELSALGKSELSEEEKADLYNALMQKVQELAVDYFISLETRAKNIESIATRAKRFESDAHKLYQEELNNYARIGEDISVVLSGLDPEMGRAFGLYANCGIAIARMLDILANDQASSSAQIAACTNVFSCVALMIQFTMNMGKKTPDEAILHGLAYLTSLVQEGLSTTISILENINLTVIRQHDQVMHEINRLQALILVGGRAQELNFEITGKRLTDLASALSDLQQDTNDKFWAYAQLQRLTEVDPILNWRRDHPGGIITKYDFETYHAKMRLYASLPNLIEQRQLWGGSSGANIAVQSYLIDLLSLKKNDGIAVIDAATIPDPYLWASRISDYLSFANNFLPEFCDFVRRAPSSEPCNDLLLPGRKIVQAVDCLRFGADGEPELSVLKELLFQYETYVNELMTELRLLEQQQLVKGAGPAAIGVDSIKCGIEARLPENEQEAQPWMWRLGWQESECKTEQQLLSSTITTSDSGSFMDDKIASGKWRSKVCRPEPIHWQTELDRIAPCPVRMGEVLGLGKAELLVRGASRHLSGDIDDLVRWSDVTKDDIGVRYVTSSVNWNSHLHEDFMPIKNYDYYNIVCKKTPAEGENKKDFYRAFWRTAQIYEGTPRRVSVELGYRWAYEERRLSWTGAHVFNTSPLSIMTCVALPVIPYFVLFEVCEVGRLIDTRQKSYERSCIVEREFPTRWSLLPKFVDYTGKGLEFPYTKSERKLVDIITVVPGRENRRFSMRELRQLPYKQSYPRELLTPLNYPSFESDVVGCVKQMSVDEYGSLELTQPMLEELNWEIDVKLQEVRNAIAEQMAQANSTLQELERCRAMIEGYIRLCVPAAAGKDPAIAGFLCGRDRILGGRSADVEEILDVYRVGGLGALRLRLLHPLRPVVFSICSTFGSEGADVADPTSGENAVVSSEEGVSYSGECLEAMGAAESILESYLNYFGGEELGRIEVQGSIGFVDIGSRENFVLVNALLQNSLTGRISAEGLRGFHESLRGTCCNVQGFLAACICPGIYNTLVELNGSCSDYPVVGRIEELLGRDVRDSQRLYWIEEPLQELSALCAMK